MKKIFITTTLTLLGLTTFGQTKLSIDSFTTFPPEIDGCSCVFSNDSIEFKDGKYIYADDFATAFLKVNGTLTRFTEIDIKNVDGTHSYTSDKYELTIEVKHLRYNGDEISFVTGTIKLTAKKGKTITKTFYGVCGC